MTPDALQPQGLLEFLSQYLTDERKTLIRSIADKRTRHITVVLEDIFHSHNAAAVLRSCDCFGVQDVHIIENRYDWSKHPKIEKGSAKWLSIHRYNKESHNTRACLQALKHKGYRIVATSPHTSLRIDQLDLTRPCAFIFGAEKLGVSPEAMELADATCCIPMFGFTESFNVSVAAALTLFAVRQRLNEDSLPWKLTDSELRKLYLVWTKNSLKHIDKYMRAWNSMQESR